MSTKMTIALRWEHYRKCNLGHGHADVIGYHLYEDLYDEDFVFLQLAGFPGFGDQEPMVIPKDIFKEIVEAGAARFGLAPKRQQQPEYRDPWEEFAATEKEGA